MTEWIPIAHQFESFEEDLSDIYSIFTEAIKACKEEKAEKERLRAERLLRNANAPAGFEVVGVRRTRTNPNGVPSHADAKVMQKTNHAKPASKPNPKPTVTAAPVVSHVAPRPPSNAWSGKVNPVTGNTISQVAPVAVAPVAVAPTASPVADVPRKTCAQRHAERKSKYCKEMTPRQQKQQERCSNWEQKQKTTQKQGPAPRQQVVAVIVPQNPFAALDVDSD
jgi:hypothetical protein